MVIERGGDELERRRGGTRRGRNRGGRRVTKETGRKRCEGRLWTEKARQSERVKRRAGRQCD